MFKWILTGNFFANCCNLGLLRQFHWNLHVKLNYLILQLPFGFNASANALPDNFYTELINSRLRGKGGKIKRKKMNAIEMIYNKLRTEDALDP